MTMPASGAISLGDARTELELIGAISLGQAEVRNLFAKPTGAIALSDGYGKSVPLPSIVGTYGVALTQSQSVTITVPAGVLAGDMFLVVISGRTVTSKPTDVVVAGTPDSDFYIGYLLCKGTESGVQLSFGTSSTAYAGVYGLLIRGGRTVEVNPKKLETSNSNTLLSFDPFTTQKSNTLVVGSVWVRAYDIAGSATPTFSPSSGWTERVDRGLAYKPGGETYEQWLLAAQSRDVLTPQTVTVPAAYANYTYRNATITCEIRG